AVRIDHPGRGPEVASRVLHGRAPLARRDGPAHLARPRLVRVAPRLAPRAEGLEPERARRLPDERPDLRDPPGNHGPRAELRPAPALLEPQVHSFSSSRLSRGRSRAQLPT